jgi:hypothetical protein
MKTETTRDECGGPGRPEPGSAGGGGPTVSRGRDDSARTRKPEAAKTPQEGPKMPLKIDQASNELKARLLVLGGRDVVQAANEFDAPAILSRGRVFPGEGAKRRRGRRSQCHRNSADLWFRSGGRTRIVTGYALSDDGLWRQHSWGCENGRVAETTEPRVLYFGYELGHWEAFRFAMGNPPPSLVAWADPTAKVAVPAGDCLVSRAVAEGGEPVSSLARRPGSAGSTGWGIFGGESTGFGGDPDDLVPMSTASLVAIAPGIAPLLSEPEGSILIRKDGTDAFIRVSRLRFNAPAPK